MLYIILIILVVVIVIYKILVNVNNSLLFHPVKGKINDNKFFQEMEGKYNIKIQDNLIESTDNCKMHYIYLKKATNDKLFLFAHGNAGNILNRIESPNIQFLLKHGSVIMFDYRGYGCSTGDPSEEGLRDDILTIWDHIIDELKYEPNNIVLYGESLGCSCVAWLTYYLLNNNKNIPKGIIMQSGFYSLKQIVSDLFHPVFSYFVLNEFDNGKYIKNIKEKKKDYPILLLHSKEDGMIDYKHSYKLSVENNCILQEIFGTHNEPIFDDNVNRIIRDKFSKN